MARKCGIFTNRVVVILRREGWHQLYEERKLAEEVLAQWSVSSTLGVFKWQAVAGEFIATLPTCFANLFVLSYFKKIKKEAMMNIYALESNKNSIMRRKGR
jgi:hypothetical protein